MNKGNCLPLIGGLITALKEVGRRTHLLDDLKNRRRYWDLKEEAEDRKDENDSLSHEHKEEIQVIFRKSMDLLISSILDDNIP